MIIKNSFMVPLPPEEAWPLLMDIPNIVSCVPGAALTEQVGDNSYKGKMKVRLGPVATEFAGTMTLEDIDTAGYSAVAKARGNEMKARGGASAATKFSMHRAGDNACRVDIETDFTLSGMVAQYGRATGMISALAQQIIDDFARCLAARIQMGGPEAGVTAGSVATEVGLLSVAGRAAGARLRSWVKQDKPGSTDSGRNDS